MRHSMKKFALAMCSLLLYGGLFIQTVTVANAAPYTNPNDALTAVKGSTTYNAPLTDVIKNILNALFGILGIIAVILVIWSGFQWMTGGTEGVTKAKERLKNAAIGLLLIMVSYALTNFIIDKLSTATR